MGQDSSQTIAARIAEIDRIFNLSLDIIGTADYDGYFTRLNPAVERILGFPVERLLSQPYIEFVHPADRERTQVEMQRLVGGELIRFFENRYQCNDGSYKWLSWNAIPYPDLEIIHFVARDITEQVLARQFVNSREQFLTLLNDITHAALEAPNFEAAQQILARRLGEVVGADGCFLALWDETNKTAYRGAVYGIWQQDRPVAPSSSNKLTTTAVTPLAAAALQTGQPVIIEDVADSPYKDGVFPACSLISLPMIAGDDLLGAVIIGFNKLHLFTNEDITQCQQAVEHITLAIARGKLIEGLEAEVARQIADAAAERDKSMAILHSAADAIAMVDTRLHIQYVNESFTRLTGYNSADAIGKHIYTLLKPDRKGPTWSPHHFQLQKGQRLQREIPVLRQDGRTYEAFMTVTGLYKADGRLVGYVSSHHDISQFKQLERTRQQFLENVSHQLKTPVTNISLYVELLERQPQKLSHYLQVLTNETGRLQELVIDILNLTSLDSAAEGIEWQPVALGGIVDVAVHHLQEKAADQQVELCLMPILAEIPSVYGDTYYLTLALTELVDNGITFTDAGGKVQVQIATAEKGEKPWVTITVSDTGPGIPAAEQAHLFERFFRGKLAEAGHITGTGLGLSLADEVVRRLGGKITVNSQVGKGTVFTIWLPARIIPHPQ